MSILGGSARRRFQVTAFLAAAIPAAVLAAFPDVSPDHPYADALAYVQEQGIVQGYPDETYRPARAVNRAEFAKIIIGARFSRPNIDSCLRQHPNVLRFRDVPVGSWFAPYLCVAATEKIISGYADGTFRPADPINVAEAAKILVGGFALTTDNRLSDLFGANVWYRPFTMKLAAMDVIPPTVAGHDHPVSRGEMAEMIYRVQTGKKSLPSVQWRTYSAASGFRFQYPADTFVAFSAEQTVPVGPLAAQLRKVPGIKLVHAAPVEHCGSSGNPDLCTPLTREITIGFYPVPTAFADLKAGAAEWEGREDVSVAGIEGFRIAAAVEGEGNAYTFLPLGEGSALMLVRSFVDDTVNLEYQGAQGFITKAQQDAVYADVVGSLVMPE